MKDDVIIFGYGNTGLEIEELLTGHYNLLGFLDDYKKGPKIIGKFEDYRKYLPEVKFCSAMASWRSMLRRQDFLKQLPAEKFITFTADEAKVYSSAKIGSGGLVFPHSIISSQVTLGQHVLVYHNCVVSHETKIGDFSIVSNSVTISGGVQIGENCYIGAGSTLLEEITIGHNSIIAAGSTVTSSVESNRIFYSPDKVKENHYGVG